MFVQTVPLYSWLSSNPTNMTQQLAEISRLNGDHVRGISTSSGLLIHACCLPVLFQSFMLSLN